MIKRYSPPEISEVWSEENKFRIWLDVEIAAMECQTKLGRVPAGALEEVKAKAKFSVERIDEIERTVKHDVISFLTNVSENVGSRREIRPPRYDFFGRTRYRFGDPVEAGRRDHPQSFSRTSKDDW